MVQTEQYHMQSLELHLFFARIMKEHALFLEAAFTPANANLAKKAEEYKNQFEKLLLQTVKLSNGSVRPNVLCSGEIITEFTYSAEQQTQRFTGICIDKRITQLEQRLQSCAAQHGQLIKSNLICNLNQTALQQLNGLICLKETLLKEVESCQTFTTNYPSLIRHILREAKLYRSYVQTLENGGMLNYQVMCQTEQFWDQIMMEHALFIRGLLDPSEDALIETADCFAKDYKRLLAEARNARNQVEMLTNTLEKTKAFRDFKCTGAKGILECKIQSIILPLLADHVLREANHYIRLLEEE